MSKDIQEDADDFKPGTDTVTDTGILTTSVPDFSFLEWEGTLLHSIKSSQLWNHL